MARSRFYAAELSRPAADIAPFAPERRMKMSQSLAKTRDRRSNAGARMSKLLEAEETDQFYSTQYGGFNEVSLFKLHISAHVNLKILSFLTFIEYHFFKI